MEFELERCPFCGEEAKLDEGSDQDMNARIPKFYVRCSVCWAQGSPCSLYDNPTPQVAKARAIALWNRRTFLAEEVPGGRPPVLS